MKFIKIPSRKGTRLAEVVDKAIELYHLNVQYREKDFVLLGFPECTETKEGTHFNKCFDISSTAFGGVYYFESKHIFTFEITHNGKTVYQISIVK